MNQQIKIHMTRKFFLAQCLGLVMLIAVLALLFWLVWLSLDPAWHPGQHRFRLNEPYYLHLLERFFETLPPWARAAIVATVPTYICWLFGSGIVSGLMRIFNRDSVAALDEHGIRCWSAFGPCKIAWPEVTRVNVMRARRLGLATHTTIRIDRTYNFSVREGHLQASCLRPTPWCLTHSMSWRSCDGSVPICVKQFNSLGFTPLESRHLISRSPLPCIAWERPSPLPVA